MTNSTGAKLRTRKAKKVSKYENQSNYRLDSSMGNSSIRAMNAPRIMVLSSLTFLLTALCAPQLLSFYQMAIGSTSRSNLSEHKDLTPSGEKIVSYVPTYQKNISPKKIFLGGRRIAPIELKSNLSSSNVRVFLFDDFLSHSECDSLRKVHDKHVRSWSEEPPLLCFESLDTLKMNIQRSGAKGSQLHADHLTNKVFLDGTRCLNETYSTQVADLLHYNWSYSTAFYPGESKFSEMLAALITETTGLKPENGGKFQITSYPLNVGYKLHTDCIEDNRDKRNRMATVLVYLDDVEEGGETSFPGLGISVKPAKGRALLWNNMTPDGVCDLNSIHEANRVTKGHKYILQRWYYYESFQTLGSRLDPPPLPIRSPDQAMVSCDEYKHGSCRWYDEWNYDVMDDYRLRQFTLKT